MIFLATSMLTACQWYPHSPDDTARFRHGDRSPVSAALTVLPSIPSLLGAALCARVSSGTAAGRPRRQRP